MKKIALLGAVGVLGLSGFAAAQTVTTDGTGTSTTTTVTTSSGTTSTTTTTGTTTTGTTTTGTTSTAGAYDRLSTGNKSIVDALYQSQVQPPPSSTTTTGTTTTAGTTTTGTTPPTVKTPLTRDQIAAMGPGAGGQGWGNVFKEMKANGYTDAKNLGSVVSSYHHDVNADRKSSSASDSLSASTSTSTSRGKFVRDDTVVGITTGRGVTEVASRGGNGTSKSGVTSSGHSSSSVGSVSHGSVSAGVSNAGGNAGGNSGSHGGGNGKH